MAIYKEPFPANTRGDEFGNLAPYRKGRPHRGQDWAPGEGKIIPAITAGTVIAIEWSDALGYTVTQNTTDGLFVLYAHLAAKPNLSIGHVLKLGDPIGKVGTTGLASTGFHLHLSIAKSKNVAVCIYDKLIDPLTKFVKTEAEKPTPAKKAVKKK
jgi:murein DD-endopeptidase MepM/ murein hydrolase activator NlpD